MNKRSIEKELMDLGPAFYTPQEYADCLKILFKINQLLGFFRSTRQLLKRFSPDIALLDIGCGGGLFLIHLHRYFPNMLMHGIDISSTAIEQAHQTREAHNISEQKVCFQFQPTLPLTLAENSTDVILSTLVCHHIDDEELVLFFQHVWQAARQAVIINDLHRHPMAYWFYKKMSGLLFRNRLITHDGLISILRSFKRVELENLIQRANIPRYEIKWVFPFRWQIILWKS